MALRTEVRETSLDWVSVNDSMHNLLRKYSLRHKLLSPKDYRLDRVKPALASPSFKQAAEFVANVESNPKKPADRFLEAADRSGATWLTTFIKGTWHPEEEGHGDVTRAAAISCQAKSEEELDKTIAIVHLRPFPIGEGYNAFRAGTYGVVQERFTQGFYEAMKDATDDPVLKQVYSDLARQENFHRFVQLKALEAALKYNPKERLWIIKEIITALSEFIMPGNVMAPDLQQTVAKRTDSLGFSIPAQLKKLANDLVPVIGYDGVGEAAIAYALKDPEGIVPENVHRLRPLLLGLHAVNNPLINGLVAKQAMARLSKAA